MKKVIFSVTASLVMLTGSTVFADHHEDVKGQEVIKEEAVQKPVAPEDVNDPVKAGEVKEGDELAWHGGRGGYGRGWGNRGWDGGWRGNYWRGGGWGGGYYYPTSYYYSTPYYYNSGYYPYYYNSYYYTPGISFSLGY